MKHWHIFDVIAKKNKIKKEDNKNEGINYKTTMGNFDNARR